MSTDVSDEHTASIFSVYEYAECEKCDTDIGRKELSRRPIGVRMAEVSGAP
jgi:hypothetical protein